MPCNTAEYHNKISLKHNGKVRLHSKVSIPETHTLLKYTVVQYKISAMLNVLFRKPMNLFKIV